MLNFNISTNKLIEISKTLFNVAVDQRKKKYTNSYIMIYQKDYEINFITNYKNISYKKTLYSETTGKGWCIIDLASFYKNMYQFSIYQKQFYNTNILLFNVFYNETTKELNIKFNNTTYKFKTYNTNELYNQFIDNYNILNDIVSNYDDYTSFSLDKLNYFYVDTYKLIKNKTNLYNNISPAFFSLDFTNDTLQYIDNRYPDAVCFVKLRMNIIKKFNYDKFEANIPIPVFKWITLYKELNNNFIFIIKDNDLFIIRNLINENTEYHSTKTIKNKAMQMELFENTSNSINLYRKNKYKEPDAFNKQINLFETVHIKNCKINLHENIFNDILAYNNKFSNIEFNLNNLKKSLALLQGGNYKDQEEALCTLQIIQNNLSITINDTQNHNKIEQNITIINNLNNKITISLNTRALIRIIKALNKKYEEPNSVPHLTYYLSVLGNNKNQDTRLCIENKYIIDNKEFNNCFALIKCKLSKYYNYYSQLKENKNYEN